MTPQFVVKTSNGLISHFVENFPSPRIEKGLGRELARINLTTEVAMLPLDQIIVLYKAGSLK